MPEGWGYVFGVGVDVYFGVDRHSEVFLDYFFPLADAISYFLQIVYILFL